MLVACVVEQRARATVEEPAKSEFAALVAWLDAGLRRGESGRLCAEYPLSLHPGATANLRVVRDAAGFAAHAMLHEATGVAPAGRLRLGMIGLVYSDPAFRGRGLATACVESCSEELRRRGVPLALLWSDKHDFYSRMGFAPAGSEQLLAWPGPPVGPRGAAAPRTDAPRPRDLPRLEALYAAKPVRVERRPGDLGRLLAAPETHARVARDAVGAPVAYAVAGRGDDFAGCVHEWAGDPAGVAACIDRLAADAGARAVLAGPEADPGRARLLEDAAGSAQGCFALARILDADALWRALLPDAPGPAPVLAHDALLTLCFGPRTASHALAMRALPPAQARIALERLPWPLYVWGLDSI